MDRKVDEEGVEGLCVELELELVLELELEVGIDVDVDLACIFHPTTAIAPITDLVVSVVVAVVHDVDCVLGVEAYVKTMPELTFDRQSPAMELAVPPAR